jgi:hypothetical protein
VLMQIEPFKDVEAISDGQCSAGHEEPPLLSRLLTRPAIWNPLGDAFETPA